MGAQQSQICCGKKMSGRFTHRGDNFVTIGGSMPGHAQELGKILVNCAYFFAREFSHDVAAPLCVSPAQVAWQF